MSEKIVQLNEEVIKGQLKGLVRGSVEEPLDEAGEQAVLRMRAFLMDCVGLSAADAGMLLSLTGDLRINQVVNPKKTCRMELPLSVLDKLGYHFSMP